MSIQNQTVVLGYIADDPEPHLFYGTGKVELPEGFKESMRRDIPKEFCGVVATYRLNRNEVTDIKYFAVWDEAWDYFVTKGEEYDSESQPKYGVAIYQLGIFDQEDIVI